MANQGSLLGYKLPFWVEPAFDGKSKFQFGLTHHLMANQGSLLGYKLPFWVEPASDGTSKFPFWVEP